MGHAMGIAGHAMGIAVGRATAAHSSDQFFEMPAGCGDGGGGGGVAARAPGAENGETRRVSTS